MDWSSIVVAVVALIGTITSGLMINHKNKNLWEYKIGELEKKMDKHNNLVIRITETERDIKAICYRLEELEEVLPRAPKEAGRNGV